MFQSKVESLLRKWKPGQVELSSLISLRSLLNAEIHQLQLVQEAQKKSLQLPSRFAGVQRADIQLFSTSEVSLQSIHKVLEFQSENMLEFAWESQRSMIGGMRIWEWKAKLVLGDQMVFDCSDVDEMNLQDEQVQRALDLMDLSSNQKWMLAFLVSSPSDEAFDIVSRIIS
jgi:hypothetical protein